MSKRLFEFFLKMHMLKGLSIVTLIDIAGSPSLFGLEIDSREIAMIAQAVNSGPYHFDTETIRTLVNLPDAFVLQGVLFSTYTTLPTVAHLLSMIESVDILSTMLVYNELKWHMSSNKGPELSDVEGARRSFYESTSPADFHKEVFHLLAGTLSDMLNEEHLMATVNGVICNYLALGHYDLAILWYCRIFEVFNRMPTRTTFDLFIRHHASETTSPLGDHWRALYAAYYGDTVSEDSTYANYELPSMLKRLVWSADQPATHQHNDMLKELISSPKSTGLQIGDMLINNLLTMKNPSVYSVLPQGTLALETVIAIMTRKDGAIHSTPFVAAIPESIKPLFFNPITMTEVLTTDPAQMAFLLYKHRELLDSFVSSRLCWNLLLAGLANNSNSTNITMLDYMLKKSLELESFTITSSTAEAIIEAVRHHKGRINENVLIDTIRNTLLEFIKQRRTPTTQFTTFILIETALNTKNYTLATEILDSFIATIPGEEITPTFVEAYARVRIRQMIKAFEPNMLDEIEQEIFKNTKVTVQHINAVLIGIRKQAPKLLPQFLAKHPDYVQGKVHSDIAAQIVSIIQDPNEMINIFTKMEVSSLPQQAINNIHKANQHVHNKSVSRILDTIKPLQHKTSKHIPDDLFKFLRLSFVTPPVNLTPLATS
eukprot:gene3420-3885_t